LISIGSFYLLIRGTNFYGGHKKTLLRSDKIQEQIRREILCRDTKNPSLNSY